MTRVSDISVICQEKSLEAAKRWNVKPKKEVKSSKINIFFKNQFWYCHLIFEQIIKIFRINILLRQYSIPRIKMYKRHLRLLLFIMIRFPKIQEHQNWALNFVFEQHQRFILFKWLQCSESWYDYLYITCFFEICIIHLYQSNEVPKAGIPKR